MIPSRGREVHLSGAIAVDSAHLLNLCNQFGAAVQALETARSAEAFGTLEEGLARERERLLAAGILGRRLDELREILESESPPTDAVIGRLLSLEGEVRGTLLRTGETPPGEIDDRRRLVGGTGTIEAAGVAEADRFIRASFLTGLERGLRVQPFGIPHHVRRTRLGRFKPLEGLAGRPVFLKLEDRQPVGSFEIRGATNFLVNAFLSGRDMTHVRLRTASPGNHALGLIQAARNLGISPDRVEVLLPKNASPLEIERLKALGATVIPHGETFEEADFLFVPALDHPLVVMGQGTVGLEIGLQMAHRGEGRYSVVVPTGGGLIAGVTAYLDTQGVPVYGVAPEAVGGQAEGVVTVLKEEIDGGVSFLYDHHLTVEEEAAAPVAALLYGRLQVGDPDLPLVLVITGQNIDPALLTTMGTVYGGGQWRRAARWRFEGILGEAGFMEEGHVRDLVTPQEGIALADLLTRHCPPGWDLIDIFDLLDWGPYRSHGEKDINATFRSYTPMGGGPNDGRNRWGGSKRMALRHALDSRSLLVTGGTDLMEFMQQEPQFSTNRYEGCQVQRSWRDISRLLVELHVLSLYLARSDWLRRLESHALRLEEGEVERFVRDTDRTMSECKAGFERLATMLGVSVDFFLQNDREEPFRRLFGPR